MAAPTVLSPREVARALQTLSDEKTRKLVFRLGVEMNVLDNIDSGFPVGCRSDRYIQAWLERDTGASWHKIVSGLEEIEMNVLAKEIAAKKCLSVAPASVEADQSSHQMTPLTPSPVTTAPTVTDHAPTSTLTDHAPPSTVTDHTQPSTLTDHTQPSTLTDHTQPSAVTDHAQPSTVTFWSVEKVKATILELKNRFADLTADAEDELCELEKQNKRFLKRFRRYLLLLPVARKVTHAKFFHENEKCISAAENTSDILDILCRYIDYRNYEVLLQLITSFCAAPLQESMQQYCQSLERFEKATPIDIYLAAISHGPELSLAFTTIAKKINKPTSVCTLYEVRKLKDGLEEEASQSLHSHSVYISPVAEVISDERAQEIIDQALKTSSLNQRNVVAVLTGLMGSGKTWLLSRLFDIIPPDLYTSTGLGEKSFRGLLHHIGSISPDLWKLLSDHNILQCLAPLFLSGETEADMASLTANLFAMTTSDDVTATSLPISMVTSPNTALQSSPFPMKPLSLPKESPTGKAMISLVKTTSGPVRELMLELVHMIDTGGQPELMEVMPSLIHNANLAVVVLNLMYGLDERLKMNFHVKGVAYKRSLSTRYTGRQIILKLASTLEAKKACRKSGILFRLLVVATHRDCVKGDVVARIEALNRELRNLLLPAFKDELILFETPDKIAFVLNLKNPNDTDKKTLALIRMKISERDLGMVFKVPGSFFVLEQDLLKFAASINRYILHLQECVQVGERLKMNDEVVKAALVLFHHQNTFLYFRHILPNHIFIKPQIPLDVVNSIVRFSYQVSEGELQGFPAKFVPMLKDGVITEEMLGLEELSSLFVPGFYEPKDAIKLLLHTFTIAPLSREQQQPKNGKKELLVAPPSQEKPEYLMMCLLPAIPDQQLPQHIPSLSDTVPLVVKFSRDCVPLSCFSSTISCLLSSYMYQWKVSRKGNGTPQCLAHNIASLYDPSLPIRIVLVDVARHIEVYIESDDDDRDILPEVCSQVCRTVFGAIERVFHVMRLSELEVSPAVLCPCKSEFESHSACYFTSMGRNYLRCSKTGNRVGKASYQHMMWFSNEAEIFSATTESEGQDSHTSMKQGTAAPPLASSESQDHTSRKKATAAPPLTISGYCPTLPELLRLSIPQWVGDQYKLFGTFLLNDETGSEMGIIKSNCHGQAKEITMTVLEAWLQGKGIGVSWESLIETLRSCGLVYRAEQIQMALDQRKSSNS